ncbi:MAG: rod shape-determining protein MreB [Gammaproteobacteria bacterium]|nr:rod shape-determining protein MreB [Gammaproteobacteria bacterium]NIR83564.1 rod shape-determining protein MreB [Gammaproteobacteria bacterium]NIR91486.1 rod shape-determining protein MreB [Gammaproteobacteria bacterium]NIU04726.1 rod shape-determining protein MreB [Gammaproteobacteria bacterium]NIV51768.1 rod shape-determining protein MreB [Gammaproteobacteria bacterium]
MLTRHFRNILYIKIRESRLIVKSLKTGKVAVDEPILAMEANGKTRVLAVGARARKLEGGNAAIIANGFSHTRSIIDDPRVAQKTLHYFVRHVHPHSPMRLRPLAVVHPLERVEGGLTQLEACTLRDLALRAGAKRACVWVGQELPDEEILANKYPTLSGELHFPLK